MKFKSIFLIANGQCDLSEKQIDELRSANYLIAVDGGINHCVTLGLVPNEYVGDSDSSQTTILKKFPNILVHQFPQDKSETDLQLAIKVALKLHPETIRVFSALGYRNDHLLQNIQLLTHYPGLLVLESGTETLFALSKKKTILVRPGQTLSLFPLNGPVHGITTEGLRWELKNATLDKHFASISNVCTKNEVTIHVEEGDLICILLQ